MKILKIILLVNFSTVLIGALGICAGYRAARLDREFVEFGSVSLWFQPEGDLAAMRAFGVEIFNNHAKE